MRLFINGSTRKKNCDQILNDIIDDKDEILSLSEWTIKNCTGCHKCINKLEHYCVLKDDMTNVVYDKLEKADQIVIASPIYMSSIPGGLKTMLDRCFPFYHHDYFRGKQIFLVLVGQGTDEENDDEIQDLIRYFTGISAWLHFEFTFLGYFSSGDSDDIKASNSGYSKKITEIRKRLSCSDID